MRVIPNSTPAIDRDSATRLVHDAETWFNARDLPSIMRGYRDDAVLELCSDGLREQFHGKAAIERGWQTVFDVFPRMKVAKQLVACDPTGTVVSEWTGSVDDRSEAYGHDLWWIDPATGAVTKHVAVSFGRVVGPESWAGRLRWLAIHPTSLLRLMRARRKS